MDSNTNYVKMTPEELASEEKKMKTQKFATGVFIGVLVGIAVWAATHGSLILTGILLVAAVIIGRKSSQSIKSREEAMCRNNTME